ncbi:MAG TPA: hypothetical protein PKY82_19370 [Pyrinomonadaceae bacterium]|nr:hypothetical protein [Pyrinomonadaceae bacterium]
MNSKTYRIKCWSACILEGDTTFLHWEPKEENLYLWLADSSGFYQTV